MTVAPTPEVAAYYGARDETSSVLRTLRIRFTIMASMALTIIVVATIVFFVKIDGKVSTIERVQHSNTALSTQRANCQITASDDVVKDLQILADGHTDYFIPKPC